MNALLVRRERIVHAPELALIVDVHIEPQRRICPLNGRDGSGAQMQ